MRITTQNTQTNYPFDLQAIPIKPFLFFTGLLVGALPCRHFHAISVCIKLSAQRHETETKQFQNSFKTVLKPF